MEVMAGLFAPSKAPAIETPGETVVKCFEPAVTDLDSVSVGGVYIPLIHFSRWNAFLTMSFRRPKATDTSFPISSALDSSPLNHYAWFSLLPDKGYSYPEFLGVEHDLAITYIADTDSERCGGRGQKQRRGEGNFV